MPEKTITTEKADYVYDVDHWDCTHEIGDQQELFDNLSMGEILHVGYLKSAGSKFAVRWLISEDGDDDIFWFDTKEEAEDFIKEGKSNAA